MTAAAPAPSAPWAFWAPTPEALIDGALELARVGQGTEFVDIGCGDGRVLAAAARRGARVRGIELDPAMAERARRTLVEASLQGAVEVADAFAADLAGDVIFAYLTPAMLARLRVRLEELPPGTRIVTPRYGVAGWRPTATHAGNHLYELPVEREPSTEIAGWPARAIIVSVPPGRTTLVPLQFMARTGPLDLVVDPQLSRAARFLAPEDCLYAPAPVPIDVTVQPLGAGSAVVGSLAAQSAELTLALVCAVGAPAQWSFEPTEGTAFRETLARVITRARARSAGAEPDVR